MGGSDPFEILGSKVAVSEISENSSSFEFKGMIFFVKKTYIICVRNMVKSWLYMISLLQPSCFFCS